MSSTTFTEADRKKLEALKAKERQAKQDARNEQKRADSVCKKLFGKTAKQVKDALENPPETHDYWNEYYELKQLVTRLMSVMGKDFDGFQEYVEWREQKAQEKAN